MMIRGNRMKWKLSQYVSNGRVLGISTLDTIPFMMAVVLGVFDVKSLTIWMVVLVLAFAINVLKNAISFEAQDAEVLRKENVVDFAGELRTRKYTGE